MIKKKQKNKKQSERISYIRVNLDLSQQFKVGGHTVNSIDIKNRVLANSQTLGGVRESCRGGGGKRSVEVREVKDTTGRFT